MSHIRYLNFVDLCRTCTSSSDQKVNIFGEDGKNMNLRTKILECLSLNISEKDRLPKTMCMQCVQQLDSIVEYRKLCKNSQDMLMHMVNSGNKTTAQQNMNVSGNNLMNTIIQSVNLQQSGLGNSAEKSFMQYTVTVDAAGNIKTEPINSIPSIPQISQTVLTAPVVKSDRDVKHSNLEEFLKMKPNLKVTPISKKDKTPAKLMQQPVAVLQQEPNMLQLQQKEITQLQLQQIQQQLQQLQQQQQLNQLTQFTQLQPQQITLSTPNATTTDLLSPSKSKKPKLNFVLTSPSAQAMTNTLPQLGTQPTQIQLQIQPTPATTLTQQQQPQSNVTTASILSNLAPLLQTQQPTMNASSSSMLSPSKCYLPITIKDENSDQQIVAHIDTKSLLLPTTYQLQMKLQPQITTVDGQTVVQLTPTATAIPTLQLQPQTIAATTQPTFQTQPTPTLLNANGQDCNSIFNHPQALQLQQLQNAQQNVQIMSQQIIRPAVVANASSDLIANNTHTNDAATSTHDEVLGNSNVKPVTSVTSDVKLQTKYKPTQFQGSSAFEITPTTNLTQQIMQQVQQQQQQKQKSQQKQAQKQQQQQQQQPPQTITTTTTLRTVPTQHGGITVQRITTTKAGNSNANKNQITTPSSPPKLPMLNKQNVTISRIVPQQQTQQITQQPDTMIAKLTQKTKPQQSPAKPEFIQETVKPLIAEKKLVRKQLKANSTPLATTNASASQQQQQHNIQQLPSAVHIVQDVATAVTPATLKFPSVQANNGTGSSLECKECGRVFKKKEHLTQHAKLHIGLRPFKCTDPQCLKTFNRKEHLLRHQISHTGQKLFRCDVCQKPFSRKDNLNKHRRIHQPNINNYVCDVCGKAFAVKAYYEQHKTIHNDNKAIATDSVVKDDTIIDQQQLQQQQIQILPQQIHSNNQHQQQQVMHLQLPVVTTTQEFIGNTITFTQHSNDLNNQQTSNALKTLSGNELITASLGNFLPLRHSQFVDASSGELMGSIKIEK